MELLCEQILDVQARRLNLRAHWWALALAAIVLLGLALRLRGITNPILDHPGWRQGDTAAIARNFALLQYNLFFPQTDYNGPPPNYVELELQIVPFLAATLYKLFGVHVLFGRLITVAFSLGTVVVLAFFGRWLFGSALAGLCAALLFAIFPGSVYYGRTFTPDTTMVFFATAALFAATRYWLDDRALSWRALWTPALLTLAALLAKPVAIVILLPILWTALARRRAPLLQTPQLWAYLAIAILPLVAYLRFENTIAEWHWASGITRLHVVPDLGRALASPAHLLGKLRLTLDLLAMLAHTMIGPAGFGLMLAGLAVPVAARSRALLGAWLGALVLYAFAVVTVERVDYYLYLFLPLAALAGGSLLAWIGRAIDWRAFPAQARVLLAAGAAAACCAAIFENRLEVKDYYKYNRTVLHSAQTLDRRLAPGALVVMGHYDPSVLYYINRKGWEEDPYLWTPFDEQSAIRKGARYFIAIEHSRLKRNVELSAWLARFPLLERTGWPVYETDPAKLLPGAEARWRAFRLRERSGRPKPG